MDVFLKVSAGILLSIILWVVLSGQGKDYGLLLSLAVCSMVVIAATSYLRELIAFLERLAALAQLQQGFLKILLKVVGIGVVAQVVDMICQDAGNQSLGKTLRFLSTTVILWITLPLLEEMLMMIESLLGGI